MPKSIINLLRFLIYSLSTFCRKLVHIEVPPPRQVLGQVWQQQPGERSVEFRRDHLGMRFDVGLVEINHRLPVGALLVALLRHAQLYVNVLLRGV